MVYRYVKETSKRTRWLWSIIRALPVFVFLVGVGVLVYTGWPIISYRLKANFNFQADSLIKPYYSLRSPVLSSSVSAEGESLSEVDNWLPASRVRGVGGRVDYYSLTIHKLGIFNATVRIGGEDLSQHLIQYGGTAYPGEYGNAVVFGHSVLPQFFDPHDYMTIFSTLPTLEYGDEVLVDFDGIHYRYKVEELLEVKPEDLAILKQRFDDSYLTLVTCVPPGTSRRRLLVRARLVK